MANFPVDFTFEREAPEWDRFFHQWCTKHLKPGGKTCTWRCHGKPIYVARVRARSEQESRVNKILRLFEAAEFGDLIIDQDLTAIKLHFGERGADSFLHLIYPRPVVG